MVCWRRRLFPCSENLKTGPPAQFLKSGRPISKKCLQMPYISKHLDPGNSLSDSKMSSFFVLRVMWHLPNSVFLLSSLVIDHMENWDHQMETSSANCPQTNLPTFLLIFFSVCYFINWILTTKSDSSTDALIPSRSCSLQNSILLSLISRGKAFWIIPKTYSSLPDNTFSSHSSIATIIFCLSLTLLKTRHVRFFFFSVLSF